MTKHTEALNQEKELTFGGLDGINADVIANLSDSKTAVEEVIAFGLQGSFDESDKYDITPEEYTSVSNNVEDRHKNVGAVPDNVEICYKEQYEEEQIKQASSA